MTTGSKIAITAAASLFMLIVLIAAGTSAVMGSLFNNATATCLTTGAPATNVNGYSSDQITNAATIIAVGKQMGIPEQGLVIAIATAMQESGLRNLDHGDRDSLGLFQQRPSQGWGAPAQLTNPTYAAAGFYRRLLTIPGWQQLSLNDAAQAVQQSATPNAYGRHEPTARAITAAVGAATCATPVAPNQAAAQAIAFAHNQIGQPYLWGGDGPAQGENGWDCSGLTKAAYATARITIPRVAQDQYNAGPRVPAGQPIQPGDLIFYGDSPTQISHVGIAISPTQMINAPYTGALVRIDTITQRRQMGITRPAAQPPPQQPNP